MRGGRGVFVAVPTVLAVLVAGSMLAARVEAGVGDLDPSFDTDGMVITDFLIPISTDPPMSASGVDAASAVAVQSDGKIVAAGFTSAADLFNLTLALARYNPDGSLDATFGSGGRVPIEAFLAGGYPDHLKVAGLALQPDGKIVVVGTFLYYPAPPALPISHFGVARYNSDGTPDTSFGGTGIVTTDLGGGAGATAVAIQGNGKIVVAGWAHSDFAVVRYDSDGSLDTGTFGGGTGLVTTDFGGEDVATGIAVQGDGKLVVVGAANSRRYAAVARYGVDGSLDSSFNGTGTATLDFSPLNVYDRWNQANAVAIQPGDGKIVVAGYTFSSTPPTNFDFALARFDPDGALDGTFGGTGMVTTDFASGLDQANGVAIQADGKIVVAGLHAATSNLELHVDFAVARHNADGSLDTSFGSAGTGKVTTAFQGIDMAHGVALQSDCKIVVAGYSERVVDEGQTGDWNFALARYDGGACPLTAGTCPRTQGYWKTHVASWPVTSLILGDQSYAQAELLALLGTTSQTDVSLTLARQLIAAKLNIANGADPSAVAGAIADADTLLSGFGSKLPYRVKASSDEGRAMTASAAILDGYNKGLLTPGCAP